MIHLHLSRNIKNTDIYLLPPALFPLQPFDTIEQRYLNSTYDPIVNPLKKSMKIELYNEKCLRKPNSSTPTHSTIVDKPSSNLDARAFLPPPDIFPTITALHKETNTIPIVHDDESPPPLSVSKLSSSDTPYFVLSSVPNNHTDDVVQALLQSRDKLLFYPIHTGRDIGLTVVSRSIWFGCIYISRRQLCGVWFILLLFFSETPCGRWREWWFK